MERHKFEKTHDDTYALFKKSSTLLPRHSRAGAESMDTGLIGDTAIFEAKRALRTSMLTEREGLPPVTVDAASRAVWSIY